MLIDYKDIEPIVYMQMKSAIKKGISHAYLFNLNENVYAEAMITDFVKNIICKEHIDKEEYNNCVLCNRIDSGNYTELKKIYPDGLWIKKEQLDELQKEFTTKSIESNKRIYMIYEAEKLNKSSANSLLKFLEEPQDGIIAILLTNNINLMLETIVSRCQLINFNKNKVEDYIKFNKITKEITLNKLAFTIWKIKDSNNIDSEKVLFIENLIKFIKKYEEEKTKTIISVKNYLLDYFDDKELIINFFECMILFYRDVLEYKLNNKVLYYDDYLDLVVKVSEKTSIDKLVKKINVIINSEKYIRSNANINLLIDNMIISMEE